MAVMACMPDGKVEMLWGNLEDAARMIDSNPDIIFFAITTDIPSVSF